MPTTDRVSETWAHSPALPFSALPLGSLGTPARLRSTLRPGQIREPSHRLPRDLGRARRRMADHNAVSHICVGVACGPGTGSTPTRSRSYCRSKPHLAPPLRTPLESTRISVESPDVYALPYPATDRGDLCLRMCLRLKRERVRKAKVPRSRFGPMPWILYCSLPWSHVLQCYWKPWT